MESYQGVKFSHRCASSSFSCSKDLEELNKAAYLLSQLGLTPVHPEGAYGNQSYRDSKTSFVITKTGMIPEADLNPDNYTRVVDYDAETSTFVTEGRFSPSSECFLHNEIYAALPEVQAILHGHSALLNIHATQLAIAMTSTFHEYGTMELARSALDLAQKGSNFFILKDHGFVALGKSIHAALQLTLCHYRALLLFLEKKVVNL